MERGIAQTVNRTTKASQEIARAGLLAVGAGLVALGIKSFLLPNGFIDGGATGVAMLVAKLTGVPLALLLVVVNAPFALLAYKHIGTPFAIRSVAAITLLAVGLVVL